MINIEKIDIENKNYPKILKNIKKPPRILYAVGNIELLNTRSFAIVGSRNCSLYGENVAHKFAKELAMNNITVISGMAIGIDTAAHLGAIEGGGNTIAVLPSGLNKIYPAKNKKLFNKIIENGGLVVTEYLENIEASSQKFLERNRIVCGLALGTVVVEAGYRSGTSVTARLTYEQGKKVFCVPSNIDSNVGIRNK